MPNPVGDPKEILKQLAEMDLDSDTIPDFIEAQDQGNQDEESKRKAARAWHSTRETLKVAKRVIEELSKEKERTPPESAATQTPQTSGDRNAQAQAYLDQLNVRAMQAVGISDSNNKLVQMEVSRLYQADVLKMEQTARAQADGDKVFNEVVSGFKSLDDSDKVAIRAKMSGMSPLDRANPETIKVVTHTYMGENIEKFRTAQGSGGNSSADTAAASQVKARGGVGAGDYSVGSGKAPETKPATADEIKGMRSLRIPLDRVDLYRRALAKKESYVQR